MDYKSDGPIISTGCRPNNGRDFFIAIFILNKVKWSFV